VPFDYDPDAPEPTAWLRFLKSVWGDDRVEMQRRLTRLTEPL
jgi:hypothetical protein